MEDHNMMAPSSLRVEEAISSSIEGMDIVDATVLISDLLRKKNVLCCNHFIALLEFGEYGILSSRLLEELGYERRNTISILNFLEKNNFIEPCGVHTGKSLFRNRFYKTKLYRLRDRVL